MTCEDTEANDCLLDGKDTDFSLWEDCRQTCEGFVSGDGTADLITGMLDPIVAESWDGDNDTFYFTTTAEGYLYGVLDWDYEPGDQDWYMICYYGDENNPEDWYVMSGDTVDLTKPEQGKSVAVLPAGTECYAWVVGYLSDDDTEPYTLYLWTSET